LEGLVRSRLWISITSLMLCLSLTPQAWAQTTGTASAPVAALSDIRGTVQADDGTPVRGATVNVHGPVDATATTDANGNYDLRVPPGVYRVTVSKSGYQSAVQQSLVVSGAGVVGNISLTSFGGSTLETIGRTNGTVARSQFNASPAAVQTLTVQDIDDQGRSNNLGKMLDEIPGISTVTAGGSYYTGLGMTDAGWLTPQIRGAFSYESAQSYDGFPLLTADPSSGFNAGLMTTTGLGGIDIIKGPGADSTTINAAVGGSINYRSLNPTLQPKFSADAGTDGLGGSTWKASATGSVFNGRLGYAFAYSASNGPGIFSARGGNAGDFVPGPYNDRDTFTYNGQTYLYPGCSGTAGSNICPGATITTHTNPTIYSYKTPYVLCCRSPLSPTDRWAEFGKLVYHLTPAESQSNATVDFLYSGSRFKEELGGYRGPTLFDGVFAPATGAGISAYSGAIPAGSAINASWYSLNDVFADRWQQTIESNLRGKLGPGYFRLGYMSLYQMNYWGLPNTDQNLTAQLYGTLPLIPLVNGQLPPYAGTVVNTGGTAPNPTCSNLPAASGCQVMTFNGQTVNYTMNSHYANVSFERVQDWLADYRVPIGANSVDLSWTQSAVRPEYGDNDTAAGSAYGPTALQNPAFHYNALKQTNSEFRLASTLETGKLASLLSLYYNRYDNYLSPLGAGPAETNLSLAQQASPGSLAPGPLWNWVTYAQGGAVEAVPTQLAISNYLNTFQHNYSNYMAPRAAFAYRLNENTSLRFSTGGSIVPLPIMALANQSGAWASLPTYNQTNLSYTQAIAPTGLKPETSWGYDFGTDVRVPNLNLNVKFDAYLTNLQNQFFTHQQVVGTYNGPDSTGTNYGPAPLVDTALQNIGHSRYEGVELSVRRDVTRGFGFVAQGYLQRAYAYDLDPSFFNLPGQTCQPSGTGCQNLGIVPNQNFNNGGATGGPSGTIGSAFSIEPYSGGYGEISYHWGKFNNFFRVGGTYYGNYNTFHEPAFFLLNASLHYALGRHLALQVSGDNLGNIYTSPFTGGYAAQNAAVAGVPAPTANGTYAFTPYLTVGPSVVTLTLQYR
jgi:outer membrane receptor protein involved in Fe transport